MARVKNALAHKTRKRAMQGLAYTLTAANRAGTIWTLNVPAFELRNLVLRVTDKDEACAVAERLIDEAGSSDKLPYDIFGLQPPQRFSGNASDKPKNPDENNFSGEIIPLLDGGLALVTGTQSFTND